MAAEQMATDARKTLVPSVTADTGVGHAVGQKVLLTEKGAGTNLLLRAHGKCKPRPGGLLCPNP